MSSAKHIVILAIGIALCAGLAQAGVLMVNVSHATDQPEQVQTSKIYIEKDRVRLEEGSGQIAIFRQDRQVFWVIDSRDNSYSEMTKQDLQQMKSKMDEASRQMEEQMKNMPPEQRQMMEQMMAGRLSQKPPEISYKKVASGETVNHWTCDKYEGSTGGPKLSDVWTTDWKNLGLQLADFNALKEMGEFFSEFARGAGAFYKMGDGTDEHLYSGVPVKTVTYHSDQSSHSSELKEVQRQDCAASLFELPPGCKKNEVDWKEGEE